jgi:hypothetical protein
MRFLLAFLILLGMGHQTASVGWAMFLCLWKIADILDEMKPQHSEKESEDESDVDERDEGAAECKTEGGER